MRESSKIIKKYAQALLESSKDLEELVKIKNELQAFLDLLNSEKDYSLFFMSPAIPGAAKGQIIQKIFKNKFTLKTLNFIELLCIRGKEGLIFDMYNKFCKLFDERMEILRVKAFTSVALQEKQVNQLKSVLQSHYKKEVYLENSIDESILGGVILKIGDKVIDGSIRKFLKSMVESF